MIYELQELQNIRDQLQNHIVSISREYGNNEKSRELQKAYDKANAELEKVKIKLCELCQHTEAESDRHG